MSNSPQVPLPPAEVNEQTSFAFEGFPEQLALEICLIHSFTANAFVTQLSNSKHVIEELVFSLWKQTYFVTISQR